MAVIELHKGKSLNVIDDVNKSILKEETIVSYEEYLNTLPINVLDNYVHKVEIDYLNFDLLNPNTRKALIVIKNTQKKPR